MKPKLAIACQGGGSHTAFTAGVLKRILESTILDAYDLVALSGTSGGGICATAAWYGLLKQAHGSIDLPYKWLMEFWADNSAYLWWEQSLNDWALQILRCQEAGLFPQFETSPYTSEWLFQVWKTLVPTQEYFDLQALLEKHIQFQEIPALLQKNSPRLLLGAVDILSGQFRTFDSAQETIRVEMLLASAAIPTLFKAVELNGKAYWNGIFSRNPPIAPFLTEAVEHRPDEIWIVQINPECRVSIPKTAATILDRRNELAGNLALNQELQLIQLVNQWLGEDSTTSLFKEMERQRFKPITVQPPITISSGLSALLDYASKLDRSPTFIRNLIADGEQQAELFLQRLPL
ncbi:patatin-like phospholipase family protein [Pantanalinema rosaneae CENA516]|uniref:patatin-like phospholipase family protein n=1 Tax=Pantanalinema rosaneae TaxID=1620701 RepID=UPI003D6FC2C2